MAVVAVIAACQLPAAASAAVAAQVIDENASAKVAMREEVCRRRKWLRLAWARNQSWIAVADAAAITMPIAAMTACQARRAPARRRTARTRARCAEHGFDLGAHDQPPRPARSPPDRARPRPRSRARRARPRAVRPPSPAPARQTRSLASRRTPPQEQRRRQEIENLHQRLRDEPWVAPQQRPFLAPQPLRGQAAEAQAPPCA